MSVRQAIDEIHNGFTRELESVRTSAELEATKVKFLGMKGPVRQLMQFLKDASSEERPIIGKLINDLKEFVTSECDRTSQQFIIREEAEQLNREQLDVTLPGRRHPIGKKHPLNQAMDEIIRILTEMGFSVQSGPDIDTEYYNFEALNFAPEHPARDMQDTFYITPDVLLRTHTSNIQARVMESNRPPRLVPTFYFIRSRRSTSISMFRLPIYLRQWTPF